MDSLRYKGFLGTVSFSEIDQVYFGKVEGIDGLVNYEGANIKELASAFHEAVDDYITYCDEESIVPLSKKKRNHL